GGGGGGGGCARTGGAGGASDANGGVSSAGAAGGAAGAQSAPGGGTGAFAFAGGGGGGGGGGGLLGGAGGANGGTTNNPGGGGGGGTNLVPAGGAVSNGASSGDGQVTISYTVPDHDLAIASAADITTDATGPSGATVSYPAPKVTDPDDGAPPAPVCAPASGTAFAIGATTVTCTATDSDDTNSPVSTHFTVTVLGAAAQLTALHQAVLHVGSGRLLARTVAQAQRQVAAGRTRAACVTLTVFQFEVRVQAPWRIPAGQARMLIADARRIQAVLGCRFPRRGR
ncbi:MAG: hypothetical protein ACRDNT_19175, partial [Streptosporangiaceae bacterium]